MIWVAGIAFVTVLALAAWAGTGRLGEMPPPVDDRPKAFIPDLPFGPEFLERLRLPVVSVGYEKAQVDRFLNGARNREPLQPPRFDVAAGGYDMQAVDAVINKIADSLRAGSGQPVIGAATGSGAPFLAGPGQAGASEALRMRNNGGVHLDSKD